MQESSLSGAEAQGAPSWYLARGDKKFGPLGTRELLLLAERGGLKSDDLLWKTGFQSWRPVREVCDLGAVPDIAAKQGSSYDDAMLLTNDAAEVEAQAASERPKRNLKARSPGRAEKVPHDLRLSLARVSCLPRA